MNIAVQPEVDSLMLDLGLAIEQQFAEQGLLVRTVRVSLNTFSPFRHNQTIAATYTFLIDLVHAVQLDLERNGGHFDRKSLALEQRNSSFFVWIGSPETRTKFEK